MKIEVQKNFFNFSYILWGILSGLQLKFYGIFSPFEVISAFIFLKDKFNPNYKESSILNNKLYKNFSYLIFLWITAQTLSDIVNRTEFLFFLKGIGAPILIFLSLRFILKIFEDSQNLSNENSFITNYFLGFSIISIIQVTTKIDALNIYTFLKFGGAISLSFFILIFIKNNFYKNIALLSLIFLALILQIRSFVMLFIIYYFTKIIKLKYFNFFRIRTINIFKISVYGIINYLMILLLLYFSTPVYHKVTDIFIALSLNSDRTLVLKRQTDSEQNFFNTRLEYFSFFRQFKDSPIFGHGSWAKDKDMKYRIYLERNRAATMNSTDFDIYSKLNRIRGIQKLDSYVMAKHSYIMQFVTWCGLIGTSFFFYLLCLSLYLILDDKFNGIARFSISTHIYHTFFSPLGNHRFEIPIICLLIIFYFLKSKKNKKQKTYQLKSQIDI